MASQTKKNYRLPSTIRPAHYAITLTPNFSDFTFTGEEKIQLNFEKTTNTVTLHAAELKIIHGAVDGIKAKITYSQKDETATFTFPKKISSGKHSMSIQFTGTLNDKMRGFYRSRYQVNGKEEWIAVTQFESTDARRAIPCIDEPSAKAIFEVTLRIPKDMSAISNTLPVKSKPEGGLNTVTFAPTPKMSTYLLAFVVGKFEYLERKTKGGVIVRVHATAGKKEQTRFALDTAVKLLEFYNDYFAIDYPLNTLDMIAIPDFAAGAMENWGAVTYREAALLVDPQNTSLANKQWVGQVVAHELAHMWFGNLVTMEWWTHLWLNEGFATFIEYVALNEIFPQWELFKQFVATEHNGALTLDALKNTHPIEVTVHHPSEISEIFDEVSYAKGSSVLYMLYTYLGSTNFRDGLRYYLKKFAYKNAATEDLWAALEKVSKKPVKKVMANWTAKPGHPVVTVEPTKGGLKLSQKRFFGSMISAKSTRDSTTWQVPLPLLSDEKTEREVPLFGKKTMVLARKPKTKWTKLNSGESSFTRIAYESGLLAELENVVSKLPTADRLGLIRDAFDLSSAGIQKTGDALALAAKYDKETEYVVWLEIANQLGKIETLLAHDEQLTKQFYAFTHKLFAKIAKQIGWEKRVSDSHTDTLLRSLALYAYGKSGDAGTNKKAKTLFEEFVKSKKQIEPDLRGIVYNLMAKSNDKKAFDFLMKHYKTEEMHQEKDRIGRALTIFEDPELIKQVQKWLLSDDVRAQDVPRFIMVLFFNPKAQKSTWQLVKSNWKKFKEQYAGSHGFSRILEGASEFTTKEDALDVQRFFKSRPTPELQRTIQQVIEQINANAEWLARDRENIASFLNSKF